MAKSTSIQNQTN